MSGAIDLAAIEARAKAATPDAVTYSYEGLTRGENPRHQFSICNGTWQDEPTRPHRCIAMVYSDSEDDAPDAEFYANARADVLALLADARAHRTRADAAEAECARLQRLMDRAVPWRVSDPPTDEEMRAIRWRWASGPERYQADADALICAAIHAREREAALTADRDTARAEADALRAIVEGRTVAPTDAEIAAHAAAGRSWLCGGSGMGSARVYRTGSAFDAGMLASECRRAIAPGVRWIPLDDDDMPCAWPTTGGGL